jgi:hypothetical protein
MICVMLAALVLGADPAGAAGAPTPPPASGEPVKAMEVQRVGGDLTAEVEKEDGGYRFARTMFIETALPVGYPPPTPPGAIEIKRYPSVRRAEHDGRDSFWPLFRHISRRNIAMTSPVEMDYSGAVRTGEDGGKSVERPESTTMSFLYRVPEDGPTGEDRSVRIVDTQPVTVLALGQRGAYSWRQDREGIAKLLEWVKANPEWEQAGEPRAFYYNGPDRRNADKWSEVHVPIRRTGLSRETAEVKPGACGTPVVKPSGEPAPGPTGGDGAPPR